MFDFSVADFATIVRTTPYVDKTLMIKDVFNSSSRILVTAPPRFGKSTNLDMIKRFLEIEVDKDGQPKPRHTTENYKLFKDNSLDICKYNEFFNEHFGSYPIMYTDWKTLGRATTNFTSMADIFRSIIVETFSLHRYLLCVKHFWTYDLDVNKFESYLCEELIKDIDEQDLMLSFKYLSRVLYRYFKKKVYVLIDNYDGFINSMLFKKNSDTDKIISLINIAVDNLLQYNHCVGRAFLTGVLPLTGDGFPLHGSNIDCYYFLHDHPFCKYYGLTSDELDKVLDKLEKHSQEKIEMKRMIVEYYNCYVAENQNVQVYNTWSVLQYLCYRKVQSSWCNHEHISGLKSVFHKNLIRNKIGQLLFGNALQLNISESLSATDVKLLNMAYNKFTTALPSTVDTIFLFFYHLGYLSVNKFFSRGFVNVKIPNEEIKYELANLLLKTYCSQDFVNNTKQVWSAIDLLQPNSINQSEIFETFGKTLQVWSHCPLKELASPHCYLIRLVVSLVTIPEYRKIVVHRLGSDGPLVIQLKNKNNVAICITSESDTTSIPTADTRSKTAENAHKYISASSYQEQMFGKYDNLCGKIVIAIGYSSYDHKVDLDEVIMNSHKVGFDVSIGYSYYFVEGDSLQNYKTV